MPLVLRLRPLTEDEARAIPHWAQARTAAAGAVERARIIDLARQGRSVAAIAQQLHRCPEMVRKWRARFNADGLAGLAERPRAGRPATYTADEYWNAHRHPFVWGRRRRHRPRHPPGLALLPKAA